MGLKVFIDVEVNSHRERVKYVLKNFSLAYKIDLTFVDSPDEVSEDDLLLFYGKDFRRSDNVICVKRSEQAIEIFERGKAYDEVYDLATIHFVNLSVPLVPKEFDGFSLPIFFKTGEPVFDFEDGCVINFDLLSCAFYFLSSWDERFKNKKDNFGRFPDEENLLVKLGLANFPVVNFYFYILKYLIERNGFAVNGRKWKGADFAVCLTHDIDVLKKWSMFGIYNEVMNKFVMGHEDIQARRERFAKFLYFYAKGMDPYRDGMKKIFEFEKSLGVRSTFFFKSGGKSKYDAKYKWDKFMSGFVSELVNSNFEIGLHPSFDSFDKIELMEDEKTKLENLTGLRIDGVRQHYLRYDFEKTPLIHSRLGFKYDSTLGFNLRYGFRSGYLFPYKIYDVRNNVEFEIYEIPLVFMDSVYQYGRSSAGVSDILKEILKIVEVVKCFGGVMTVLFHNSVYDEFDFKGWDFIYEEFVKFALNEGAFVGSCGEVLSLFENE